MDPRKKSYSVAVFPLLQTSRSVRLGSLTFHSTEDSGDLPADQEETVNEIAGMLYASGNQRIERASYAIVDRVDLDYAAESLGPLADVEAVVTYIYARPRHVFDQVFLHPEETAMAVLTPDQVPPALVRQDFNVLTVVEEPPLEINELGWVSGYSGTLGFRHSFWAGAGSRLYSTVPYPTLNRYQDLARDIKRARTDRVDYRLLLELLNKHGSSHHVRSRVFTAIRWYNRANSRHRDEAESFICLSVALETLLRVPREAKRNRVVDAISLLLGRDPRLEEWAKQFYRARSSVVHEGSLSQASFVVRRATARRQEIAYQSLLAYGREIFQLCLGTVLTGASLSSGADLETKMIANSERFEKIMQILQDSSSSPAERLRQIEAHVTAIRRYRWVKDTGISSSCVTAACVYAAKVTLESDGEITRDVRESLSVLAIAPRSDDSFERMHALCALAGETERFKVLTEAGVSDHVASFFGDCWMYVYRDYYRAKDERGRPRGRSIQDGDGGGRDPQYELRGR